MLKGCVFPIACSIPRSLILLQGYGIRFLPSYIESLEAHQDDPEELSRGEKVQTPNLEAQAVGAKEWIDSLIEA